MSKKGGEAMAKKNRNRAQRTETTQATETTEAVEAAGAAVEDVDLRELEEYEDLEELDGDDTDEHGPTQTDTDAMTVSERALIVLSIELPMLVEAPVYDDCIGRVDLRLPLQSEEVYMMASVRMAAMQRGDKLWNGQPINSNADVVRWILQRAADLRRVAA